LYCFGVATWYLYCLWVSAIYFCCPFSVWWYKCAAVLLCNLFINVCSDFVFFNYVISVLFGSWLSHYNYVYCSQTSRSSKWHIHYQWHGTWQQIITVIYKIPLFVTGRNEMCQLCKLRCWTQKSK
jgi:hypothetical protein